MKTRDKIGGHIIRSAACAVFLSAVFVALSSAFQSSKTSSQARAFSFAERVAYQRAIEDVHWRHRIWPKENPDPKPSLDAVMSQAQLEDKVAGYLRDSLALEDYGQSITAEQLQAEMERMARNTKQPEVLQEMFQALGNDPAVVAECLARPILAERLIADLSVHGQTRHVESQQPDALRAMSVGTTLGQVVYILPEIADTGELPCTDQWGATSTINAPSGRDGHTAVWTGSEMIVWGGGALYNTGGRYNPSTDSWTATSTNNAPLGRVSHTAVWTGNEMIVWGGIIPPGVLVNTGGRYNPSTNSWRATSTTNAPTARTNHTAVWTGSAMIVWGGGGAGINEILDTGGRYNPSTDSWIATSTNNPPTPRLAHTAVWTGSGMIVWGGLADSNTFTNTGGRYNPSTDSWTAISTINAPSARFGHTAVWTESEMIVWGGGSPLNTGGRYDPNTDSWTATSTIDAPTARGSHTAVWTGSEMIVWSGLGINFLTNTGGRYCGGPYPTPSPTVTPTPTAPPLRIIQPNGGEVWLMRNVQEIKWNGANLSNSDRVIIQYSRNGGATWFRIAQDVPALSFSYSWQVDNFPTTQGRVKILLQGNRSITDQSDANFNVQRRPFITLHTPNGGEFWTVGQHRNFHWTRQNPGGNTVDIDYSTDNGTSWIRIATQAQDTGWFPWIVPGPATTTAKARIYFHETPSVTDTSEAVFTISL